MKPNYVILALGILTAPIIAQDAAKPAIAIDLGAEGKTAGFTVTGVLFGMRSTLMTEESGFQKRTFMKVEVLAEAAASDDLLILHVTHVAGKSANIGNDKTCKIIDAKGVESPLVGYAFDIKGTTLEVSTMVPGQVGILLGQIDKPREIYLAFKRPTSSKGLRTIGVGNPAKK